MKIIFVSNTCSKDELKKINNNKTKNILNPSQKFFNLLFQGLASNENVSLNAITSLPISYSNHKKVIWKTKRERTNEKINYIYLGTLNLPILRNIMNFIISFKTVFFDILMNKEKGDNQIILCDILAYDAAVGAFLAGKLLNKKCIAVVTDLPFYMEAIEKRTHSKIFRLISKIKNLIITRLSTKYDAYVLLTDSMNEVINPKEKPNIVIEGFSDVEMDNYENSVDDKYNEKVVLYAGGLYKKFGLEKLVKSAKMIKTPDFQLRLYGEGEYSKELRGNSSISSKVKYFGLVDNEVIIKEEIKATLLVNPRPSNEVFTKFSFPSKITEYMSTGTPVLTTKLEGIPKEYHEFLFFFESETEEGFAENIDKILQYPSEELVKFGASAKKFVLEHKNNIAQSKRLIHFIDCLI